MEQLEARNPQFAQQYQQFQERFQNSVGPLPGKAQNAFAAARTDGRPITFAAADRLSRQPQQRRRPAADHAARSNSAANYLHTAPRPAPPPTNDASTRRSVPPRQRSEQRRHRRLLPLRDCRSPLLHLRRIDPQRHRSVVHQRHEHVLAKPAGRDFDAGCPHPRHKRLIQPLGQAPAAPPRRSSAAALAGNRRRA